MTAQYKPYRDEESVDGLETTSWTDHEPGSIQIYEKTTEELPFNSVNKKSLWIHTALYILTIIFGFLLGYFMHSHSHDHVGIKESSEVSSLRSIATLLQEDPTIKDKLLEQLDGHNILALMDKFKDVPRTPGSPGNHELATHVQNEFLSYGLDPVTALNHTFKTMLPSKPTIFKILDKNNETIFTTESRITEKDDPIPFLPLSQADETVLETDQIMYLNRGSDEDYAKLASLGVNSSILDGKILVIRQTYYGVHGIIINAQENGAKAVLLFPDPELYGSSSPFPQSVQVPNDATKSHPLAWSNYGDLVALNLSTFTGGDVTKLGIEKESKVQIPVALLSYNEAKTVLVGLSGSPAPKEWNCFDFTLHIGPGYKEDNGFDKRDKVRLEFYNQGTIVTSTTITGIIAGSLETDRYIVIGSRRDSITRGILDSVSGTAVMLEIARVFGVLAKQGWRPKRTIVFNSFGAESLNLIGSSNWLEVHQRLLHSRAVAYINCDVVVTGNQTVTIAASPLLYQVLYNATRQVTDPNNQYSNVYRSWSEHHSRHRFTEIVESKSSYLPQFSKIIEEAEKQLDNEKVNNEVSSLDNNTDLLGRRGEVLQDYKKSAFSILRPKVNRLDLQSIYSPFFLYAGIPVVDVRYTGFPNITNKANILKDTLPLLGTKYDNLQTVQHIDPHLKYHVTVAQILSEILRDLSDSVYLPFNLLDYAVTLSENYDHLVEHYGKMFNKSKIDLDALKRVIDEFTVAVVKFHHRQDHADVNDPMQIRRLNDQMMLLERAFLDPDGLPNFWERKHLILAPNDGQEHKEGFPGLVDWITLLDGESMEDADTTIFTEILKVHFRAVIYTISNAIKVIEEVHIL